MAGPSTRRAALPPWNTAGSAKAVERCCQLTGKPLPSVSNDGFCNRFGPVGTIAVNVGVGVGVGVAVGVLVLVAVAVAVGAGVEQPAVQTS